VTRRLVAGATYRPRWLAGGVPVEGPDEDAFTLAVAAAERLGTTESGRTATIDRLELVGEFPPAIDRMLLEALGLESAEVHRHGPGVEGFAHALNDVGRSPLAPEGAGAVITVDVASARTEGAGPSGAVGVALLFADGPGAELLGHATRSHPPERPPVAAEWIRAAHRAHPTANSSTTGRLGVIARAAPPVLLAEWSRIFPAVEPVVVPWLDPGTGALPSSRPALALRTFLERTPPGDALWLAAIQSDRTEFLAIRGEGPVVWADPVPSLSRPTPADGPFPSASASDLLRVSEGAYVARPRYVENLPSRWRFVADRCAGCGTTGFPARGRCRSCGRSDGVAPIALPREGLTVLAATTIHPGAQPTEFDPLTAAIGPYSVVIAAWPDGPKVTLQVADAPAGTARVGDRIGTELRRLYAMEGDWRYGRKAVVTPGAVPGASAAPT